MANKQDKFKIGEQEEIQDVVVILDESGSMGSVREDTIGGFNSYVSDLKNSDTKFRVTLYTFCTSWVRKAIDGVLAKDVVPLTTETYRPNDGTPLYDAIGKVIKELDEKGGRYLVTIMTDGYENSSSAYTSAMVKELIQGRESAGWTFAYLGADQDAWSVANTIGVAHSNSASYAKGAIGDTFGRVAEASIMYAAAASASVDSVRGLYGSEDIDADVDKDVDDLSNNMLSASRVFNKTKKT